MNKGRRGCLAAGGLSCFFAVAASFVFAMLGHEPASEDGPSEGNRSTGAGKTQAALAAVPAERLQRSSSGILVVYPRSGAVISAPSTFLIGACPPGRSLTVNGEPVRLNALGYFAHVVPLQPGTNTFQAALDSDAAGSLSITVKRPAPPAALPPQPLRIDASSAQPKESLGVTPGDIVQFGVRATPGSAVAVTVGAQKVPLSPASRGKVNLGLGTAFGVSYQQSPAGDRDLYVGFYKVQPGDDFKDAPVKFLASKAGENTQHLSPARITVVKQPSVMETAHDNTVVRLGPGQARSTPLAAGVRLLVDGWRGDHVRCELAPGKHVFVERKELVAAADAGHAPFSTVTTVNLEARPMSARIVVPLNQRLPYQIEQQVNPNRLVLRIFGATADTDWITPVLPAGQSAQRPRRRFQAEPARIKRARLPG